MLKLPKQKKQDKFPKVLTEIDKRLTRGESKHKIATDLKIPLHWITESEMDMDWSPNFNLDKSNEA